MFFGFKKELLRKLSGKAIIGYMKINIIKPPEGTYWGQFNDRAISDTWVDTLFQTFCNGELDRCTDRNTMDVAVDRAWLDGGGNDATDLVDGYTLDEVPEIAFTVGGKKAIKNNNLWMLSGNHRRLALKKYVESLKATMEEAQEKIDEVKKDKSEDELAKLGEGARRGLEENEAIVEEMKEKIEEGSYWTVRLMDRGACHVRAFASRERDGAEG